MSTNYEISTVHEVGGRIGCARRYRQPITDDMRRDLAAAKIRDYVKRILLDAPPLTEWQREKISQILGLSEPTDFIPQHRCKDCGRTPPAWQPMPIAGWPSRCLACRTEREAVAAVTAPSAPEHAEVTA